MLFRSIKSDTVKHTAETQSITQGTDAKDGGAEANKGTFADKRAASQSSVLSEASINSDNTVLKTDVDKIATTQSTPENSNKINANTVAQNAVAQNTVTEPAENTSRAISANSSITETEKADAIDALTVKDANAIKTDKVLASLTPEQLSKLNDQIKADSLSSSNSVEKLTALKQMLTQFITDNEQTQKIGRASCRERV